MSLIAELKRRSVFKVGAAYLVVGWIVVQAASIALPAFDAPPGFLRGFILVVLLGFPVALVLAWAFELTPEGVKVDAAGVGSRRLFIGAAALIVAAFGWYFVGQAGLRGHAGEADPRSIAVLPFVNMSADPNQEFFSDGIAEELLNRLAQSPELKVAARTSAFQFKGKNLDVADIGRQLKVSHVLEGSVRRDGSQLRITAQLIDTATGYHLWSQTYDRDATNVFAVQDEIAQAIANALEATLSGAQGGGAAGGAGPARTVDPAAYDDYLLGRALVAKRLGDNLKNAVAAFDRAIAKDPNYSPAHSGRAFALAIGQGWNPWLPLAEANRLAIASADRALELDPGNAEAYMVRATVEFGTMQFAAARSDYERAYALAPGSVDILNFYGDYMEFTGALRRAEALKRQAMALDPLAFVHPYNLSSILGDQGRYAEALQMAERAMALGSGGSWSAENRFWIELELGRFDAAAQAMSASCTGDADTASRCEIKRAALRVRTGDLEGARREFAQHVTTRSTVGGRNISAVAALYSGYLQDIPRATAAMRRVFDGDEYFVPAPLNFAPGGSKLPEEVSQDPEWLALWADPRVAEFMALYRENIAAFRAGR